MFVINVFLLVYVNVVSHSFRVNDDMCGFTCQSCFFLGGVIYTDFVTKPS